MSKITRVGDIQLTEAQIQQALKARADGGELYYGKDDSLLDFGSANSFMDEDATGKRVSMRITNGSTSDHKIQLNEIIASITGAKVIAEGTKDGITITGTPRSVDVLKNYVSHNPMRIRSIKLNVSEVSQLDEPLIYHTESPFETMAEKQRVPSEYQSQNTNNPKMSEVADIKDWVLSNESTIVYNVQAGKTVNLTFVFGASVDIAKALNKKADAAARTAAKAYVSAKK